MKSEGSIFALDLGTRLGYAIGRPGETPRSGAVLLKQKGDSRAIALGNLIAWLNARFSEQRPSLVVKEAALPLQAYKNAANSEAGVLMAYGLHGIVEGMCVRFGIRLETAHAATIRKHFIGQGRVGTRQATKAAVVARAKLLKYTPADCTDEDRADALAVWDWAASSFGKRSGGELVLFQQHPKPKRRNDLTVLAAG